MLTFEKVIEVFKDYLTEDTRYEIVMTSHGYTVLEWDSRANTWAGEELCATPEIMRDVLLDCFTGYLEYKAITAFGEAAIRTSRGPEADGRFWASLLL